jgi:hypothetical protein
MPIPDEGRAKKSFESMEKMDMGSPFSQRMGLMGKRKGERSKDNPFA